MFTRLPSRLLALGAASAMALLTVVPPAGAVDRPVLPRVHARATSDATAARQALADAKSLFKGGAHINARGQAKTVHGRDATMVLRDLAVHADDLPTAAERTQAKQILARPTNGDRVDDEPKYDPGSSVGTDCGAHICVHWVEDGSADAVTDDGDTRSTPAYVKTVLSTMEHVYAKEVTDLGYRAPLPDDGTTGTYGDENSKTDVYLADLGSNDLYGYCTSDDPNAGSARRISAYCVLDNDYARSQYPVHTALQNLQVTAAHEFFHAVQYAYNSLQDQWFMEGTAAWMEDEVYDNVNDNRQYLADSPLTNPFVPVDYSNASDAYYYQPYGAWIFWRFMSERAHSATIIRKVWEQGTTHYSTWALSRVLRARGSSFASWFAAFGTWSASPATYFSEGGAYPRPAPDGAYTLSSSRRSTGGRALRISHMARSFITFKPSSKLGSSTKLKLYLNMTNPSHGSLAQIVVHGKGGGLTVHSIKLNRSGNGTSVFGFNPRKVSYLKLDLMNASTRFDCYTYPNDGTQESCYGDAVYDYQRAKFSASLTH